MTAECGRPQFGRPRHEVAEIFRARGAKYRRKHCLSPDQLKAMHAMEACRTAKLGGHLYLCDQCGHEVPAYNSCRNRHCPKCQSLSQARWIRRRKERILTVQHFHVVFTLPQQLRSLAFHNRQKLFRLLFHASAHTLLQLGRDPERLGVQLGITSVLHTWTRKLHFHPHVHCVVTAGGLAVEGSERWIHSDHGYLFPVKVMGKLFRGKYLAGLRKLYDDGELSLDGSCRELRNPEAFRILLDSLYRKDWIAYCKPPFGGTEGLFHYLGRYTHRTGISDHRITKVTTNHVTFHTKNDHQETVTLEEFIRRFLLHILPTGFVKIRHYGLLASGNVNTRLERARNLLWQRPEVPDIGVEDWIDHLKILTGIDFLRCPQCRTGRLHPNPIPVTDTS
ncbi:IS91 family transposase [Myxococcota bacterium]